MYRDPDDDTGARITTRLVLVGADDMAPPPVVPAVIRAAARAGVRGQELAVLIELHEHLSVTDWRVVRVWYVARTLGIHREAVSAALRHLASAGFVLRSGAPARMRYRLAACSDLAA